MAVFMYERKEPPYNKRFIIWWLFLLNYEIEHSFQVLFLTNHLNLFQSNLSRIDIP